jgi:antitoxin component YwqK of YwqJK toxin-antitoxin module
MRPFTGNSPPAKTEKLPPRDPTKLYGQSKSIFGAKQEKDLLFKGKIILGKREGLGKLYHINGTVKYNNNFCSDEYSDLNARINFSNGCPYYVGGLSKGLKNGNGTEYYKNKEDSCKQSYSGDQQKRR